MASGHEQHACHMASGHEQHACHMASGHEQHACPPAEVAREVITEKCVWLGDKTIICSKQ